MFFIAVIGKGDMHLVRTAESAQAETHLVNGSRAIKPWRLHGVCQERRSRAHGSRSLTVSGRVRRGGVGWVQQQTASHILRVG